MAKHGENKQEAIPLLVFGALQAASGKYIVLTRNGERCVFGKLSFHTSIGESQTDVIATYTGYVSLVPYTGKSESISSVLTPNGTGSLTLLCRPGDDGQKHKVRVTAKFSDGTFRGQSAYGVKLKNGGIGGEGTILNDTPLQEAFISSSRETAGQVGYQFF